MLYAWRYINAGVRHEVELEAFNKVEIKKTEGNGYLGVASETLACDSNMNKNLDNISVILKSMQKAPMNLQNEVKGLK